MNENLYELMQKASVLEVTADEIKMRQLLDPKGVCIIPAEQAEAAEKVVEMLGRKVIGVTGSKRGNLCYKFEPPLTEEEYEDFFG